MGLEAIFDKTFVLGASIYIFYLCLVKPDVFGQTTRWIKLLALLLVMVKIAEFLL